MTSDFKTITREQIAAAINRGAQLEAEIWVMPDQALDRYCDLISRCQAGEEVESADYDWSQHIRENMLACGVSSDLADALAYARYNLVETMP